MEHIELPSCFPQLLQHGFSVSVALVYTIYSDGTDKYIMHFLQSICLGFSKPLALKDGCLFSGVVLSITGNYKVVNFITVV